MELCPSVLQYNQAEIEGFSLNESSSSSTKCCEPIFSIAEDANVAYVAYAAAASAYAADARVVDSV